MIASHELGKLTRLLLGSTLPRFLSSRSICVYLNRKCSNRKIFISWNLSSVGEKDVRHTEGRYSQRPPAKPEA